MAKRRNGGTDVNLSSVVGLALENLARLLLAQLVEFLDIACETMNSQSRCLYSISASLKVGLESQKHICRISKKD